MFEPEETEDTSEQSISYGEQTPIETDSDTVEGWFDGYVDY